MAEKTCVECGAPLPRHCSVICLNPECHRKHRNRLKREIRGGRPPMKKGGPIVMKTCPVCGKEYRSLNARQIYCSKECYSKDIREKAKEEREKYNPPKKVSEMDRLKALTKAQILKEDRARVAREAREAGMSYGKYVALKNLQVLKGI